MDIVEDVFQLLLPEGYHISRFEDGRIELSPNHTELPNISGEWYRAVESEGWAYINNDYTVPPRMFEQMEINEPINITFNTDAFLTSRDFQEWRRRQFER